MQESPGRWVLSLKEMKRLVRQRWRSKGALNRSIVLCEAVQAAGTVLPGLLVISFGGCACGKVDRSDTGEVGGARLQRASSMLLGFGF